MPNRQEIAAKAVAKAEVYFRKRQYEQALAACDRAIKTDPNACEAYAYRWLVLGEILAPDEIGRTINPEVESFLATRVESPEVLFEAYWGYMRHPDRTKNVPDSLFKRMLAYPGTDAMLTALLGLAEQSQDPREKWAYNRRVIDEFTASGISYSYLSWYLGAYQNMLRLAKQDRTLVKKADLDKLIERRLQTRLTYLQTTKQAVLGAYTESANYRLDFGIGLDRALEILACAEARLQEKEELEYYKSTGGSVEEADKALTRLRGKIYVSQGKWRQALRALQATTPAEYTRLSARYSERTIEHFYLLGRAEEGLNKLDRAARHYTDAHFAPQPHAAALAGLKRVYKTRHGALKGFKAYLRAVEAEYRKREATDREEIGRLLVQDKMEQKVPNFHLESVDGLPFRLADMRGSVVLFDVWASWCGWCHRATPKLEKVYEHFLAADDVALLGINDGESPEKVEGFLRENQPPWLILLDPKRKVSKACEIHGIPCFILIDKKGQWQYKLGGYNDSLDQELIWLIDELRKTADCA